MVMLVMWIACRYSLCARTRGICTVFLHGFTITVKKASRQVRSHKLIGRQGQEGKHVLQVSRDNTCYKSPNPSGKSSMDRGFLVT